MIPILYEGNERVFLTNGLGRLADAKSCIVTEERNGEFELEMTYPIIGVHYSDIKENRIILAKTSDADNNQAFTIYKISKPLNGIITINAQHISYLLSGFPVMPFTAVSLPDAFEKIQENIVVANSPFVFQTTIASSISFTLEKPKSARSILGGERGSILDVYGGYDYEFDNFNVYLKADRGHDNGVTIRHGKNLTALESIIDTTNVYTGIVPFWKDSEGNAVYLTEKVVYSEHADDYPYKIVKPVDFSSDFEMAPTEQQLRSKAISYLNSNRGWRLKNSIDISFVNLSQTEEYKGILKSLERVKLCDTVTVIYDALGINLKIKVIKTVYNTLTERYDSISLGDTTYTLAKAISDSLDIPTNAQTQAEIQSAVSRATKLIQGGLGGYVVFNTNGNGQPQEILIMDADNIEDAVSVIRMNKNGIGFSRNGYSGPYQTAWTIDGHFVADFIDTGQLNGGLIKANTVSADVLSVGANSALGTLYSYVPNDWNTNVNRWEINAATVSIATATLDGETIHIFQLYKESGSGYASNYQTQFKSNYISGINIHFDIWFNFWRSSLGTVNVPDQQFMYLWYPDSNGIWHEQEIFRLSGEYNAQSDDYDASLFNKLSADITLNYDLDLSKGAPRIGFRFVPVGWTEIVKLDVYSFSGDYNKHILNFDNNGLAIEVQSGNIISTINQSAEQVSINASKINLTGDLSLRGDFTSYDPNDDTTRVFLDSAKLSFFNQGSNVFTISAEEMLGGYAGIFFGDPEDFGRFTSINQDLVTSPSLYLRRNGIHQPSGGYSGDALIEGDLAVYGTSIFHGNVYDDNGSLVFVSDKRKKKNIKDLTINKVKPFLMALKPRSFKFKNGTSGRNHHGFIAQEVMEVMGEDWGLYVEDKKDDFIGLRYDELMADMIKLLQDHENRITNLEGRSKE